MTNSTLALSFKDIDPFDPEVIAQGPEAMEPLRDLGPVFMLRKYGVYATVRHDLAATVLRHWETFTSTVKAFGPRAHIPNILVTDDPPVHSRVRKAIMGMFTPAQLRKYTEKFDEDAEAIVGAALEKEYIDGVDDLASAYVLKVFPDAVGITDSNRKMLLDFAELAFNSAMPLNDLYKRSLENGQDALAWLNRQCERDAISQTGMAADIYSLSEGGTVSEEEAALLVRAVLTGGFDTSIMSISSGLNGFGRNPGEWDKVRSDPSIIKGAYEEVLRYDPPSRFLGRGVTKDTELGGVHLRQGDRIACFLIGAGRDPDQWENPNTFDVTRRAMGHLSFGAGLHTCLGQAVARMEFNALIGAMARMVTRIEPTGEPVRNINNQASGWRKLPLRIT
ncbi:MAG: cytochrome P450 [Sulfitobacter sp.]